ncbi:hypothetical protein niasHT_032178 [Heterodera trifolii]|uniref:F-box domain-containing protein n=1 Tax=Heterodera trifolii TaxID=157864 RepID=A0ABD2I2M0_9BILA
MLDSRKEAEEKMAKAIFISADCWLSVFELLEPFQLGLGIAMISHRFNFFVDEHFKTRKWALRNIQIRNKIGGNGTNEMEIVKSYHGKPLPIPKMQLPRKVSGFKLIDISFIDRNVIAFLDHFRPLFAACPISLAISTYNDRILEFILHNIWPMFGKNIYAMELSAKILRQFVPTILNDFLLLRVVYCSDGFFTKFPCDDSAAASDGQMLAKWLFTPLQNDVPKVLKCWWNMNYGNWSSTIEAFKAEFANASSPAKFIVVIWFPSSFVDSIWAFDLTNELTHEQLTLKRTDFHNCFLLIRCPIARDESKWTKWEKKRLTGNFIFNGTKLTFKFVMGMTSEREG